MYVNFIGHTFSSTFKIIVLQVLTILVDFIFTFQREIDFDLGKTQ